jgi:outer membrane receptor protein involved in Fe transport
VICVAIVCPAVAQEITATLRGIIFDADGTPLPGVPVTVKAQSRGDSARAVVTDLHGRFKFPLMPPATDYFILVNYPGFAATELGPIDLDAGKTTLQDIKLQLASALTEKIEVTAHGNIVDTESTKTSTTFNTEFVEGLPVIGRSYQDILTLTPGVTDTDGDGNPNVQGARETGLQYRLDGGNITDPASGTFGQNLNLDAIEEIEVITAGASAEYGRADGGFANIITKSGGNDMEGTFRLVWRGAILDGDGAGENNDTFFGSQAGEVDLRDLKSYLTLGGAIVRDKLWYFASAQYIDQDAPLNLAGATLPLSASGQTIFGKVTWQVDADNKIAFQYNEDPYEIRGGFLDFGISRESDAVQKKGGRATQMRWTSIVSPTLLVEALIGHFDSGIEITPVSSRFHPTEIETIVSRPGGKVTVQALHPIAECSVNGASSGFVPNCDPTQGRTSIYQIDNFRGTVTGPYPTFSDDTGVRNSVKADLTYSLEDFFGEHQLKSGMEFADEKYENEPINNPYFVNSYRNCRDCRDPNNHPVFNAVEGFKVLTVPVPIELEQKVVSFNSSAYLQDVWKPAPNLTVQFGLRIDKEDVDTSGFDEFDPRAEKRRSISIVERLCEDGLRVSRFGSGQSNADNSQGCDQTGRIPGDPPAIGLKYTFDNQTPDRLRQFDRNFDGVFDSGVDGSVWEDPYTVFIDREPENFAIQNLNLSPRFSIAWDPFADGKTKLFSAWGRYHDRLFLDTVAGEIGPDVVSYVFLPDPTLFQFLPGMASTAASAETVIQVDRNLQTPFTDVFTLGVERALAPEWSLKLTYTQRLGWGLLQDSDINHLTCSGFPGEFGIRKEDVCKIATDSNGDPILSDDIFGDIATGSSNGAPDLYIVNSNFNQVFRVANLNSSSYRSLSLELNRRLHRNWQSQLSYTWSRVYGQAESYLSGLGDDPSRVDDEEGYLAYDQRHRVVLIATTQLPKDVEIGTTLTWESGTPYSITGQLSDADNDGNVAFRTYFPTGQRNDQRNDGYWGLDARLIKRFQIGDTAASGSLAVNNILNDDDLTLSAYRETSFGGVALQQGPQGLRRFGRFWEMSFSLSF